MNVISVVGIMCSKYVCTLKYIIKHKANKIIFSCYLLYMLCTDTNTFHHLIISLYIILNKYNVLKQTQKEYISIFVF